jgi:hypothetical protein
MIILPFFETMRIFYSLVGALPSTIVAVAATVGCLYWVYREVWSAKSWRSPAPKHILMCGSCRASVPVYREIKQTAPPLMNLSYVCVTATGGNHVGAMPLVRHHLMYWDPETDETDHGDWELVCGVCGCNVALSGEIAKKVSPPGHPSIQMFGCLGNGKHLLREVKKGQ